MKPAAILAALSLSALCVHGGAAAHDRAHPAAPPPPAVAAPFPVDVTARFDLIDQTGTRRTEQDFRGAPMLVFFGYANCEAICDVALPAMAQALDLLGPQADRLAPILVTIDPEHDTPERLALAAPAIHPRLVALTGSPEALAAVRSDFGVTVEKVFEAPDGAPVYAHGSFVYLIGADGALLTVLPPILTPDRIAEIVRGYL